MKTLHLSIMIFIVGISFVVSNNANGCTYCPMIPSSNVPSAFTLSTDLENYITSDKIMITVYTPNPDNNTSLVIKILGPDYNLKDLYTFSPDPNRVGYTWTVIPNGPAFYNSGNYTVMAQYGQDHAVINFFLHSTQSSIVLGHPSNPLQQFKSGIAAKDVKCHDDLLLTFKAEDGSPACVNPETAKMLYLRGWASILTVKLNDSSSNQPVEIIAIRSVGPVNPGGPIIQLTLKNIGIAPITSLKALLTLNNDYTFDFKDVTESKPLAPGQSASDTKILIGAGSTELVPLTISGVGNNISFRYTENVHVS